MGLDHRFLQEGDQGKRIAGGPHGNEHRPDRAGSRDLSGRDERFRPLLAEGEPRVLEVGHHADHLPPLLVAVPAILEPEPHALSDGFPLAGQVAGERLVDHDHSRAAGPVEIREEAPPEETQAHRVEIAGTRPPDGCHQPVAPLSRFGPTGDPHRRTGPRAAAGERQIRREPDRRHRRQALEPRHGLEERRPEPRVGHAVSAPRSQPARAAGCLGIPGARGDHVGRVVPAVAGDEPDEAAQEQARPDEQHHREGHLHRRQPRPRPIRAQQTEASGSLRAPLVQYARQAEPRPLERWCRAERQPDDDRQREGEREARSVDPHVVEARDVAGDHPRHHAEHDRGRCQAEQAAGRAQHYALGQELAHEPRPTRPQRRADRERPPASHAAREQETGQVDAGNQQHESGRRGQGEERRTVAADHLFLQGNHPAVDFQRVGRGSATLRVTHLGEEAAALENSADLGGGSFG